MKKTISQIIIICCFILYSNALSADWNWKIDQIMNINEYLQLRDDKLKGNSTVKEKTGQ